MNREEYIVLDVPAPLKVPKMRWRQMSLMVVAILVYFLVLRHFQSANAAMMLSMIATLVITILIISFVQNSRVGRSPGNEDSSIRPHIRALSALSSRPRPRWFSNWPHWNCAAMKASYIEESSKPLSIVVDAPLDSQIRTIELSDALLEPEPIGTSGFQRSGLVIFFTAWQTVMIVHFVRTGALHLAVMLACVNIVILLQVPKVRDAVPGLARVRPEPVAGVGWVRDPRGRLWTTDDSTLIVASLAKGKRALVVHLVGDAGSRTFTYQSTADPEFISLWKRWAHPNPRPDLAGQV